MLVTKKNKISKVAEIEKKYKFIRTVVAILIALIISFILIAVTSSNPVKALRIFMTGPLTSINRMGFVVEKAIPLLFTGTAICIMYKCGQINVSIESGFFFGGVIAAWVAVTKGIPEIVHPVLAIIAGGVAGAFIAGIVAIWHTKFKAMTLVTSLMLNYVFLNIGQYIINYIIWDPYIGYQASYLYEESSKLSKLFSKTGIHSGLFLAIAVVIFGYVLIFRTKFGYSIRMIGKNENFAKYSGIKTSFYIVACQLIGGFIAGAGGAVEQLGMYKRFTYGGLSGHGFDGVTIAVISGLDPRLVPIASLFLGYIRTGAEVMSRQTDVPTEIVAIVQAIVIVFVAAERFLTKYKEKEIVKNAELAMKEGE